MKKAAKYIILFIRDNFNYMKGAVFMKKALKCICAATLALAFAYGVFKIVYTVLTEKKDYFEAPL